MNAIWYFVEGDSLNGWASLASALPGLGTLAGKGIRLAFGKSGRVLSLAKLVEDGSRLVGHGVTFGQAAIRGLGTVLEAGAVLLDVATCITTGKSIRGDLQEAANSFRNAGQDVKAWLFKGRSDTVTVYRGTNKYTEQMVYNETGLIMSDSARSVYLETGDINQAYAASQKNHNEWIGIWGDENTYVQAHGEFGTELSQAFSKDRSMVSVTTDKSVAGYFG